MKKIVIFGAGNIGRSFIGQLFSRSSYEVVFVDVDDRIVNALNERRRYRIEVKDVRPETIWVENVRAIHGKDVDKVADEIATANIMATAVGPGNLQYIYGNIARGLLKRLGLNRAPIDIIICENIRDASKIFREGLSRHLPVSHAIDSMVGLVETSIGKMVPIMTEEQRREDPLLVFAEAYNILIADKRGFKQEIPNVQGLEAKENMTAYVDQKLFIHNMGHAVTAYVGYITNPEMKYIWEAITDDRIRRTVEGAMWESGRALIAEYPEEFNKENMKPHISDLICRFANKALGDTIYRVGRDISRKISRDDRMIGALRLEQKHEIPAPCTTIGTASAMLFRGTDEGGSLYENDRIFAEKVFPRGIEYVLKEVCGLDPQKDRTITDNIKEAYEFVTKNRHNWFFWLKS